MPENLGATCAGFLGSAGAPCYLGLAWSPRSGTRLERRHQKERSPVSAAGLSGPPACLAPRRASLLGCPLFASVPHSETTQRLLLRLRAMWEPRFHRAEPGRRVGERPGEGSKWAGGE